MLRDTDGATNGGIMATISRQIEVDAAPPAVGAAWSRFIEWVHVGPSHLACDDLACVDAVRAGLVTLSSSPSGKTIVVFRLDAGSGEPAVDGLEDNMGHDLVMFKDYVEHQGMGAGRPTHDEAVVLERTAGQHGDAPRHVRLSSEEDTTFWRSHFPT